MLILTRRVGETLLIGDDIAVTVVGTKGHQVQIAIKAPKTIPILREELFERMQRQQQDELQANLKPTADYFSA